MKTKISFLLLTLALLFGCQQTQTAASAKIKKGMIKVSHPLSKRRWQNPNLSASITPVPSKNDIFTVSLNPWETPSAKRPE